MQFQMKHRGKSLQRNVIGSFRLVFVTKLFDFFFYLIDLLVVNILFSCHLVMHSNAHFAPHKITFLCTATKSKICFEYFLIFYSPKNRIDVQLFYCTIHHLHLQFFCRIHILYCLHLHVIAALKFSHA